MDLANDRELTVQDHAQGYRLSPQQHLLWTQSQEPSYLQASFTLPGSVDRQRLLAAFNTLVEDHEVLRTDIKVMPGGSIPAQYVNPYKPLSALPEQLGRTSEPAALALVCKAASSQISLRLHAMCGDPWTLEILLEQLDRRYASQDVVEGQAHRLQYPDLAEAFNQLLTDQEGLAYWHRRSHEVATSALEKWRSGWRDAPGLRHARRLEWVPRSSEKDRLFERWALFVSRLTHCPLVQLCYRAPGQQMLELEALGPMARSLPVSYAVDAAQSIAALMKRIGEQLRDDLAHAMHCAGVAADAPTSWFQFDAARAVPGRFAGFPVRDIQLSEPMSRALLQLSVVGHGDELRLQMKAQDCSETQFTECTRNFERWLNFCECSPDAPLAAFEWQPLDERLLPVDTRPLDRQSHTPSINVLGALRDAALRTPDKMALQDAAGSLSYAELQAQVLSASRYLAVRGISAGDVVALQLARGRHWISLWLACWQLGAVALPVSLREPASRLARLCSLADVRLLLTDVSEPSEDLPPCVRPAQCQAPGDTLPAAPLLPGAIAYVLFTSGSTGEPKATAVSHGALTTYLLWARQAYASESKGGTVVHSELSFDFTQPCLWLPLLAVEPIYFAAEEIKLDGIYRMLLETPELSFIKLAPAHLQGISAIESNAAAQTLRWPAHVVVGGAALSGAMLPPSLRSSAALIHNEYGPTEATVGCSLYSVRADRMGMEATPIGTPSPGNRLLVLDEYLNRMPPSVAGELYIAGEQLAQGYLGNPRETALRFVPHPFAAMPGQRMYRSGDRVERLTVDCHLYRGRMDDMVKRNGFRIEPGEITVRMLQHVDVTSCHSFVQHDDGQPEPRIVCAVVFGRKDADVDGLRAWLASALPEYMLPNEIVAIDAMPLTRQGKVDASRLKLLLAESAQRAQALLPGTESALGAIWRDVLGARPLGPGSNFFVEGGDSIRAITVAVLARKSGWPLTVEDLFKHPVLRDLAACCETAAKQPPKSALVAAQPHKSVPPALPAGAEEAFPLSQLQLGMIYQNQAYDQDFRYHDIFSYGLELQFDENSLREAARRLVRRHPCLRTSFDLTGLDEPLQIVWAQGAELLDVQDLSAWSPSEQQECVQRWISQELERGFDTSKLPLVRIKVHVLGAREIQLTTSFHHAVMDGWSDQQIHTELFADYSDLLHDRQVERYAPSSRYRDFVEAERAALGSAQTRKFWADLLAGKVSNELSPELAVPAVLNDEPAGYRHLELDISDVDQQSLQQCARDAGQALSVLLLSVHMLALALLCGRREVLSGAVSNCRLDEDAAERAVGLYINTLPVIANIEAGPWSLLIQQMGDFQQAAFAHRRLPFAEIQRDMGVAMLSQSLFYFTSFHNGIGHTQELRQLRKVAHEVTSFPLTASFNLDPLSEQITCRLSFDSRRFTPQRVQIVQRLYAAALASLAGGVDKPLPSAEQLLPMALRSVIVAPPAGHAPDVLAMFGEQVRKHGSALAVEAADRSLSYRQLDSWSDSIACDLLAQGMGAEKAVAVSLPRSAMLVAALLGVLKAGACFTVLDPDNPPQRLRHMLEGADLLLCGQLPAPDDALPGKLQVLAVCDMDAQTAFSSTAASASTNSMQSAYRMYTSGTTGTPKCVVLGRGNLANVLWHFRAELSVHKGDRVLLNSALSFDISLLELFVPLISGASLVILDRKEVMDPGALAEMIDKTGASLMQATPSQWAMLRAAGWRGSRKLRVLAGGEALPAYLGGWLADACAQVWNVYGPTETCIWSSAKRLSAGSPLTLGVPIAHTRCYVLDEALDPVPLGSEGVLYIGGAGVSRGYQGDAAASAAAFLPDRFTEQPGERMYSTGDRVLINTNAELVFLGRSDRQIKLAGHRLELAEIEACLLQHPSVAAAIVIEAIDDEQRLVAYLMAASEASAPTAIPSVAELRLFLSQSLAPYAVPGRYVWIDEIPRTRNGKLDLSALPVPDKLEEPPLATGSPQRAIERLLQRLWSRVLHVEAVGVEESFVSLGGYSLSAIQIVAQLRKLLDIEVSAALVFSMPTIVQFANHLLESFPTADIEAKAEIVLSIL